jgi:hypothetical protein
MSELLGGKVHPKSQRTTTLLPNGTRYSSSQKTVRVCRWKKSFVATYSTDAEDFDSIARSIISSACL